MLNGIRETARQTIDLILEIRKLMQDYKQRIRANYPFYSQELLNNLFVHPYTKIDFLAAALSVHRQTASRYLDQLAGGGLLKLAKIGRTHYYINEPLFALFSAEIPGGREVVRLWLNWPKSWMDY